MTKTTVSYVTNSKGQRTAVQISLREWNLLQKELKKLELLQDLKHASHEMKQHESRSNETISQNTKQLSREQKRAMIVRLDLLAKKLSSKD